MASREPRSKRFYVSVTASVAAAVEELARRWGRPPTTVAGRLLSEAAENALHPPEDEIAELRRQLQAAVSERDRLRRQVHEQREVSTPPAGPRYEWAIENLMRDQAWWEQWLPRLDQLMGRWLSLSTMVPRDDHGYLDLGQRLFRPIGSDSSEEEGVSWRSAQYPAAAWARWQETQDERWREQALVWEPVVRHLAEALCLLEDTADEGDAYLRLRAKDEITGPWLTALRTITGEEDLRNMPPEVGTRLADSAHRR